MRKLSLWFMLICFVMVLTSCSSVHIEDTNGDVISLCSLTEENIFSEITSYTSFASLNTQIDDSYHYSVKKLSGIYTVNEVSAEGESLIINATTILKQGNLRIVILCEGKYVADIPIGMDQSVTVNNPNGSYEIRLAAESAELEMDYSFSVE